MLDLLQIKITEVQIKDSNFIGRLITPRRITMDISAKLTLEQQFKLQILKDQVQNLSHEQAQEYLIEMFRQMMVKDNLVKHLLKNA